MSINANLIYHIFRGCLKFLVKIDFAIKKYIIYVVCYIFSFNRVLQVVITSQQKCAGKGIYNDCNLVDTQYWSAIQRLERMLAGRCADRKCQ